MPSFNPLHWRRTTLEGGLSERAAEDTATQLLDALADKGSRQELRDIVDTALRQTRPPHHPPRSFAAMGHHHRRHGAAQTLRLSRAPPRSPVPLSPPVELHCSELNATSSTPPSPIHDLRTISVIGQRPPPSFLAAMAAAQSLHVEPAPTAATVRLSPAAETLSAHRNPIRSAIPLTTTVWSAARPNIAEQAGSHATAQPCHRASIPPTSTRGEMPQRTEGGRIVASNIASGEWEGPPLSLREHLRPR